MTKPRSILAILLATTCMVQAHAAEWPLRANGIGPLRIGMSFAAVDKAVQHGLEATPATLRPTLDCDYLPLTGHPGIYLLFTNDKPRRIDLTAPGSRMMATTSAMAVCEVPPSNGWTSFVFLNRQAQLPVIVPTKKKPILKPAHW